MDSRINNSRSETWGTLLSFRNVLTLVCVVLAIGTAVARTPAVGAKAPDFTDYKMTNLYGLRWDAPHETAYPSTFIRDKNGTILFEKISHSHGDRTSAEDILGQLKTN